MNLIVFVFRHNRENLRRIHQFAVKIDHWQDIAASGIAGFFHSSI